MKCKKTSFLTFRKMSIQWTVGVVKVVKFVHLDVDFAERFFPCAFGFWFHLFMGSFLELGPEVWFFWLSNVYGVVCFDGFFVQLPIMDLGHQLQSIMCMFLMMFFCFSLFWLWSLIDYLQHRNYNLQHLELHTYCIIILMD